MKDPCNECLVSAMCAQLCWKKKNYETLLKNALRMINKKTLVHNHVNDFLKYNKKYKEHRKTLNEIQFRKLKIIRDL